MTELRSYEVKYVEGLIDRIAKLEAVWALMGLMIMSRLLMTQL